MTTESCRCWILGPMMMESCWCWCCGRNSKVDDGLQLHSAVSIYGYACLLVLTQIIMVWRIAMTSDKIYRCHWPLASSLPFNPPLTPTRSTPGWHQSLPARLLRVLPKVPGVGGKPVQEDLSQPFFPLFLLGLGTGWGAAAAFCGLWISPNDGGAAFRLL